MIILSIRDAPIDETADQLNDGYKNMSLLDNKF